jgi:steroid 5-alpha reductase family enzyme
MLSLAGAGWILAAAVMALLWLWHLRLRNAGIVDGGCAFLVGGLAVLYAVFGGGWGPRRAAIAFMMGSWGARLTVHVLYDRAFGRPEEGRYADLRQRRGDDANAWFFWFFEAHAVAAVCFSLPALVAAVNSREGFSPFEYAGAGLWMIAFTGEVTADRQLERFNSDPVNRGRACQTGLWRYSRHPNYVFDVLVWVAFATYATGSPWGWLAWACPAAMVALPTAICPFGVGSESLIARLKPSRSDEPARPS